MGKWGWLSLGSLLGGFGRYLLAGAIYALFGTAFPYGTFVVNMTGCFLIGVFYSLAEQKFLLGPDARIFLMTGFCGAFTTFSTFILETMALFKDGEALKAFMNIGGSVGLGLFLFWMAEILVKLI